MQQGAGWGTRRANREGPSLCSGRQAWAANRSGGGIVLPGGEVGLGMEEGFDQVEAFAGGLLEGAGLKDFDLSPPVADPAEMLQPIRHHGHGGAGDAEHGGEELLLHDELLLADAVVHHLEPAAEARLERMGVVADGGEGREGKQGMGVVGHEAIERGLLAADFAAKNIRRHAERGARSLDKGVGGGGLLAQPDGYADAAFIADDADFCRADAIGLNGGDHVEGEINELIGLVGLDEGVVDFELDRMQKSQQALLFGGGKRGQD